MNETINFASTGQIHHHDMSVKAIFDMEVCDSNGETVGDVEDLLLSDEKKINSLIVLVGSTLGVGGKLVAIPFSNLNVNYLHSTINLGLTADELEDEPEFEFKN
ncbi:MAG: PRC-barrel domain containing protein [Nitrosomonas sp.]|nr:MAG: PRC-barrel domain containing protein [Nitrosomonas sp.]